MTLALVLVFINAIIKQQTSPMTAVAMAYLYFQLRRWVNLGHFFHSAQTSDFGASNNNNCSCPFYFTHVQQPPATSSNSDKKQHHNNNGRVTVHNDQDNKIRSATGHTVVYHVKLSTQMVIMAATKAQQQQQQQQQQRRRSDDKESARIAATKTATATVATIEVLRAQVIHPLKGTLHHMTKSKGCLHIDWGIQFWGKVAVGRALWLSCKSLCPETNSLLLSPLSGTIHRSKLKLAHCRRLHLLASDKSPQPPVSRNNTKTSLSPDALSPSSRDEWAM